MVLLNDLASRIALDDPEERRVLSRVSWAQYEALLADLGDSSSYRVHFLDGVLELLAPKNSNRQSFRTLLPGNQYRVLPDGIDHPEKARAAGGGRTR